MFVGLVLVWLGAACAPPPSPTTSRADGQPAQSARTLVVAVQNEPTILTARPLGQGVGGSNQFPKRIFNADLVLLDDQSNPMPYLAEALPQLDTDTWKVFPDGRMETAYRLRPNLIWHDGTPLTADDFVFAWQVFSTPELGTANALPIKAMASVEAPDSRTVLIRWSERNAMAGALQSVGFSGGVSGLPLPRIILGSTLASGNLEAFIQHAYWTQEFVGMGPYRLDRWEPGAFIEASAFDRHALGAPKIQRIKIAFYTDSGAAFAAMLAGDAHVATDSVLNPSRAATLLRQWPPGGGYLVPYLATWAGAYFQGRSELAQPPALLDRRVRQALAHAIDRPSLNDAIFEGQYLVADTPFAPTSGLGRAANEAVAKYPFDLGRSRQLMTEAGFSQPPGADVYVGPSGDRFSFELKGDGSDEQLTTAIASSWRQDGFAVSEATIPTRLTINLEIKSQYPGLFINSTIEGERGIGNMHSDNIPTVQNGWRGVGLGFAGYSSPEVDRLVAAFRGALDVAERNRIVADIARVYSTDLPAIPLFFPVSSTVFSSDVKGPQQRRASSTIHWNIYEWELR